MKVLFSIIIYLFLVPVTIFSQESIYRFERITTDNGLLKNDVYNITQDSLGFLWFGTDYGLNRYDGYEFKYYLNIAGDTASLTNNYISKTLVDSKGNLWVLTNKILHHYNYETDDFTRYPLVSKEDESQGIQLSTLIEDNEGNLWIGNSVYGLFYFNTKSKVFKDYSTIVKNIGISSVFQDSNNLIWIGGDRGKLFSYNRLNNNIKEYVIPIKDNDLLHDAFIYFINENTDGEFLIGSANGLFKFNKQTGKFSQYNPDGINSTDYSFKCYYSDTLGYKWYGTSAKGLFVTNGTTTLLRRKPNNYTSLSNNEVQDIFKDRSGVYWIATMGGVNKFDPRSTFFTLYQNDPNDPGTLGSNNVSSFCEDEHHDVWIGIMGGGINILNSESKKISPITDIVPNVPKNLTENVFDLCVDNDNYIWIATHDALYRYNQELKKFYHYDYHYYNPRYLSNDNLDEFDGKAILSLSKGIKGDLWLGTYGGGLTKVTIDEKTNTPVFTNFKNSKNDKNSLSNNFIRKVFVDRFNIVWIGTLGSGLDRYDPNTNTFTHYPNSKSDSLSISNNFVTEIYEDYYGNLWVGTYEGLNKFDREKQTFTKVTHTDGRPILMISELLLDQNSNLWITTDNGLYKYNQKANTIRKFGVLNGLQGNNFNINALFTASDGSVYIGGRNGTNVFKPNDYTINKYIPEVVITGINIDNNPIRFGYKDGKLVFFNKDGSLKNSIDLTYKNRIISITYSSLSYSLNKQNHFAYKLEGLNTDWVYTDAERRMAMFTNLRQGTYTFRVKASNSDRVWNDTGASFDIVMAVPYWKTWWAILLYIVIFSGIMFLVLKFILIKKKLENDLLVERLDRERIIEINQMKIEFFSNISHEFRTPLTLILSPAESLLKYVTDMKISSKLQLIHNNANRLLNLVNQLLDFRKSEADKWELNTEQIDLVEFIEDIKKSFNELASKKNIIFELNLQEPRPVVLWFDRMKMKSVFYNLLSNAFKFTPEGKKISIVIRKEIVSGDKGVLFTRKSKTPDNQFIVVDIIDEGIGISKEKIPYIFDRFYTIGSESLSTTSTGIGLTLVKKIVSMHQGQVLVDSIPNTGSRFSAFIPLGDINKSDNMQASSSINVADSVLPDIADDSDDPEIDEFAEEKVKDTESPLILIIEDDNDIRQYIIDELENEFQFKEATNGMEGLAIAKEIVPDLILSDVIMPKMQGTELCHKLKEDLSTNHIPVILLTAKSSEEDMLVGLKTGADSYLTKPFSIDVLKVKMQNLLESRVKLREKYSGELLLKPKNIIIEDVDGKLLVNLIEIIENNMGDEDFGVKTLANEIGLSRMQLYRKLKAIVNKTPHELINTIRMERAVQLLLQKQLTISEVAYSVGFNTPKYFSRCFKEQYSMLPSQYIKNMSESTDNNSGNNDDNGGKKE